MASQDKSGLKSAFDLAMERMAQRGDTMATLTPEQKDALAELNRRTKAKIAELEIMFDRQLSEAKAADDAEKAAKIEELKRVEIGKLRAKEEVERAKIRG